MNAQATAVILIGLQNDYFSDDGSLVGVLEDRSWREKVLENIVGMVKDLAHTPALIVSTPIQFTENYEELSEPVGILQAIIDNGAFRRGTKGAETIPEIREFGQRIVEVQGKRGLNAFSNTELHSLFETRGITDVVLAGVVTSICIDSTGRHAFESGYRVSILADGTAGRTSFEQTFYCENVFPLYSQVMMTQDFVDLLR